MEYRLSCGAIPTCQITLVADRMPKNKPPATRLVCEHMPKLLEALGKSETNAFEQNAITAAISEIAASYWASHDQPTVSQTIRLLRQVRHTRARERKLWEQLEAVRREIDAAGFFRNSENEEIELLEHKEVIFEEYRSDLDDRLHERDLDIEFLIKNPDVLGRLLSRSHHKDYRKRAERALVIEPFLKLLQEHEVVPSRARPLIKMVEALFLVIGIKKPPSNVGVRQIVIDLKNKTKR